MFTEMETERYIEDIVEKYREMEDDGKGFEDIVLGYATTINESVVDSCIFLLNLFKVSFLSFTSSLVSYSLLRNFKEIRHFH